MRFSRFFLVVLTVAYVLGYERVALCTIMLCSNLCNLNTLRQLRRILPTLKGFRCSSSLLGERPLLDLQHVFIRSLA